ncbi:chymotrypsinogen A-like [Achroia grisella]|uniref:chymotrypsinogen A-like n=1 Tax=Achroia grisella TaxID=688607 RepID=UPI0027D223A1|nr:chymotrypsinogen A-like [Achroia grisella]
MFLIFYWVFFFTLFGGGTSKLVVRPVVIDDTVIIPRVVNGKPATLGEVPYQVAFKIVHSRSRKTYITFCGGTIIAPTKLVSAAHCFELKKSQCAIFQDTIEIHSKFLRGKYAVAGNLLNVAKLQSTNKASNGGQWRKLKKVIYPSRYNFPNHDIAVVMIFLPFDYNDHIAAIPYTEVNRDYNGKCLVSGYGRKSITKHILSDKLLTAHLDLIPSYSCSRMHRKNMRKFVCTSSIVTDVGKGDSGGPLVCANTGDPKESNMGILVGVVSGHRVKVGSFFTRVSSYREFIQYNNANTISYKGILNFIIIIIYGSFSLFSFRFI